MREYTMGHSIVDAVQEGHRDLNRKAAKISLQIVEMYGVHKYTHIHKYICSSILYVHTG